MSEAKESFTIPNKKRKLSVDGEGTEIAAVAVEASDETYNNQTVSDRKLLNGADVDIHTTVEAYIQGINGATRIKQTIIAHDAEQDKKHYVKLLDQVYRFIMRDVERAFKGGYGLCCEYGMALDTRGVTQNAIYSAFQCAATVLERKGWSPIVSDECVTLDDKTTFSCHIGCSFK